MWWSVSGQRDGDPRHTRGHLRVVRSLYLPGTMTSSRTRALLVLPPMGCVGWIVVDQMVDSGWKAVAAEVLVMPLVSLLNALWLTRDDAWDNYR